MKNFVQKSMMLALMFLPILAFAGPGFGGGVADGGSCDAPLDGGLSLLAASGIGYGIKTFLSQRKKSQSLENCG